MTAPATQMIPAATGRANWLGRVLKVQTGFDKQLRSVMNSALDRVHAILSREPAWRTGSQVKALQLRLAQRELRGEMATLWGDVEDLTYKSRQDAAQASVDAFIYDQSRYLTQAFRGDQERRARFANSMRQTARANVEAMETRVLGYSYFPLAESVYRNRELANGRVDAIINVGLALGHAPRDIAKDIENLIDPKVPGGISYAAKRLGRTELNNAFHAQSIKEFEDCPWITDVRWNLSKMHKDDPTDICEELAFIEFFPKTAVPVKPHPNCMCYITPKLMDRKEFEDRLIAGEFDDYAAGRVQAIMAMEVEAPELVIPQSLSEAQTFEDIENYLNVKYPEIKITNMGAPLVANPDVAREIAQGYEYMLDKYPEARKVLREMAFGLGPNDEYARTITRDFGTHVESIVKWNSLATEDPSLMQELYTRTVETGYHPVNTDVLPYRAGTFHEMFHVLDSASGHDTHDDIDAIIDAETGRAIKNDTYQGGWRNWLNSVVPSTYSLDADDPDWVSHDELIAESGLDVEYNGKGAKRISKLVYNALMRRLGRKAIRF